MKSRPKLVRLHLLGRSLSLDIRFAQRVNDEGNMEKEDFDFGKNLEYLILKKYKSIASFAREIGKNPKTVQEWCGTGGRFPSKPEDIKLMAHALNLSLHELMFGTLDGNEPLGSLLEKTEIHSGLYEITVKKVDVKNKGKK